MEKVDLTRLVDGPFELPLDRAAFAEALRKGLGRALMHVRARGAAGVDALVIDACVDDKTLDSQSEPERWPWMTEIVDAAGMWALTAPAIINMVESLTELNERDQDHVCNIAAVLAKRGFSDAMRALYMAFDRSWRWDDPIAATQAIKLNARDGLLHVARRLGQLAQADQSDDLELAPLWILALEFESKGDAERILEEAASSDRDIRAYLAWWRATQRRNSQDAMPQSAETRDGLLRSITATEIIERMRTGNPVLWGGPLMAWAKIASDAALQQIADAIFAETDEKRLRQYLWAFRHRGLPSLTPEFLAYADHENEFLRNATLIALSNTRHPLVREFAMRRMAREDKSFRDLSLLCRNHERDDHVMIEAMLEVAGDVHDAHDLVYSLIRIFKENPVGEAQPSLVFAYEHSPCMNCRKKVVGLLLGQGLAPAWLAEECRFDANEEIRELVLGSG